MVQWSLSATPPLTNK
uniref:Uncharacterized protein n=1 Tax=Anguilla anguilla TaxID=7936 RepID=A0A0E9RTT4_ANGAN